MKYKFAKYNYMLNIYIYIYIYISNERDFQIWKEQIFPAIVFSHLKYPSLVYITNVIYDS